MLGKFLALHTDDTTELDIDAAYALYKQGKFKQSSSNMPGLGVSKAIFWAAITVENGTQDTQKIVIEQRIPTLRFTLYRRLANGAFEQLKQGFRDEGSVNMVGYYLPAFELEIAPGQHEIFFRLESLQPTLAVLAWDLKAFHEYMNIDFAVSGAIFGAMAIMVLYNMFVFLMARRREHLFYVLYLSGFVLHQLYLSGFGSFLLGERKVLFADYWAFIVAFGTISALEFTKSFLMLDGFKGIVRTMRVLQIYFVLLGLLSFVDMHWANRLSLAPALFCFGFIIYAGIKRARLGYSPAYYFVIAWVFQVGCIATVILSALTILPFNRWTAKIGPIGVLLEMVLISLAIGEKIRVEREAHLKERETNFHEREAHLFERDSHIRALSLKNQEIQHAVLQMKKVFFPHQVQLIEEGVNLEETMPTGGKDACVICFDIVQSSDIKHEKTAEFFSDVFRRCTSLMMEGYDGNQLKSSGYRIKLLGDGFLCSVGYPFTSQTGHMSKDAIDLAMRFYEAFEVAVNEFAYKDPICCCIGIALESISGFFPDVGTIEYDIFGRGIVLATRYENMRKHLFPNAVPSSMMILHERVYLSLSETDRRDFTVVDLESKKLKVKDDAAATHLYYRDLGSPAKSAKVCLLRKI